MTSLLKKYAPYTEFESYEDFLNNFKINVPENFNFAYDVVDEYAKIDPEKLALVWCNDYGEEKIINFSELKILTDKAANLLQKNGIKKGDSVILTLKSRYEFWIAIIALHKLGAVAVPATHMLKTDDIVYRFNKTKPKAIISISDHGIPKMFDEAQKITNTTDLKKFIVGEADGWADFNEEVEKASADFKRPEGDQRTENSDPMLYYFSSGTSGFPKMVIHDFEYPLGHIITSKYWQNVIEDELHYTHADSGWAKCVWGKLYGQWICGAPVLVYDSDKSFDVDSLMEKITKYKVATFCSPPTVYRFLIKEDMSKYDFSHLKYCVVAGEALNPEVYNKFLENTGIELREGYGQTEMIVSIATFPWVTPKPGSIGKPAAAYYIDIIDANGRSCDVGEQGEIVVRTPGGKKPPGLFCGYKDDPVKTKEAWNNDIYYTGDTAWKDEEGYYWFIGRTDDIIKSSGYKISPFEVESAVMKHPAVLECAVTSVPDEIRGQVVKATIILTRDYKDKVKTKEGENALRKEIQNFVKNITAPYKYPRVVEFVDELPKTISGKIRRVEIREKDSQQK